MGAFSLCRRKKKRSPEEFLKSKIDEGSFRIKDIQAIRTSHTFNICSICKLKDKRLVSASADKSIIMYSQLNRPQIRIHKAHVLMKKLYICYTIKVF